MCDKLTAGECDHLMSTWRVCRFCETAINKDQSGFTDACQCLYHYGCSVPHVRDIHLHSGCSLQFKRDVISGFVRKTFGTQNVLAAYQIYMKLNCPTLWKMLSMAPRPEQDRSIARIDVLENENVEYKQKCEQLHESCEELRRKSEMERQESIKKLKTTQEELSSTTAKLTKLRTETNLLASQWKKPAGARDDKEKVTEVEDSSFSAIDNCWLELKKHFDRLQKKLAEMWSEAFSTKDWKFIGKVNENVTSAVELHSKVYEEVMAVMKTGIAELQMAIDGLVPLETEFPSSPEKKANENTDEQFLE